MPSEGIPFRIVVIMVLLVLVLGVVMLIVLRQSGASQDITSVIGGALRTWVG